MNEQSRRDWLVKIRAALARALGTDADPIEVIYPLGVRYFRVEKVIRIKPTTYRSSAEAFNGFWTNVWKSPDSIF